jgi:nucleotide-binding universal stress UspA family protein
VGYRVQTGYPAAMIIEQADSQDDTLILMSTHGYSGVQRLLLGSIAAKVVQAANAPLLLVPAAAKSPSGELVEFERLIVPLDGSELAESILPLAVNLCKTLDMELILVRSYHPSFPGTSIKSHDVSQIVHDAAESYIKDKFERLTKEGLKKVSYKLLRGNASEQITDFALETPNSVTVMCTHGRHGISRWVLGSVTSAVIQSSEEPILVIRSINKKAKH